MLNQYENRMMTPKPNGLDYETKGSGPGSCPSCGKNKWKKVIRSYGKRYVCKVCGHVRQA